MIVHHAEAESLRQMLLKARSRTLALMADLSGAQLLGPRLAIVNPPLWEIGHLGWFQERWCVRRRADGTLEPSMLPHADALFDSATVPHEERWDLPLPPLNSILSYVGTVLSKVCERLSNADSDSAYFAQLCAEHEEMHAEAFTYTRQTLGLPPPPGVRASPQPASGSCGGDVAIAGGEFLLGAPQGTDFVFDNEKWLHRVYVAPFAMARAAVTNAEFVCFVDDNGYSRPDLWSMDGWTWREAEGAQHPVYWCRSGQSWHERRYDAVHPPNHDTPVMHVNWYEAQAYCRWAGRRLPTEAEWEYAAAVDPLRSGAKNRFPWGNEPADTRRANLFDAAEGPVAVNAFAEGDSAFGCRQMIGNVWEWTADAFRPYPGFVPDPYAEYSQPWFGNHKVLRGGSHATRGSLIRNTWRNFHTPDRRDVFAGFRTCAA